MLKLIFNKDRGCWPVEDRVRLGNWLIFPPGLLASFLPVCLSKHCSSFKGQPLSFGSLPGILHTLICPISEVQLL